MFASILPGALPASTTASPGASAPPSAPATDGGSPSFASLLEQQTAGTGEPAATATGAGTSGPETPAPGPGASVSVTAEEIAQALAAAVLTEPVVTVLTPVVAPAVPDAVPADTDTSGQAAAADAPPPETAPQPDGQPAVPARVAGGSDGSPANAGAAPTPPAATNVSTTEQPDRPVALPITTGTDTAAAAATTAPAADAAPAAPAPHGDGRGRPEAPGIRRSERAVAQVTAHSQGRGLRMPEAAPVPPAAPDNSATPGDSALPAAPGAPAPAVATPPVTRPGEGRSDAGGPTRAPRALPTETAPAATAAPESAAGEAGGGGAPVAPADPAAAAAVAPVAKGESGGRPLREVRRETPVQPAAGEIHLPDTPGLRVGRVNLPAHAAPGPEVVGPAAPVVTTARQALAPEPMPLQRAGVEAPAAEAGQPGRQLGPVVREVVAPPFAGEAAEAAADTPADPAPARGETGPAGAAGRAPGVKIRSTDTPLPVRRDEPVLTTARQADLGRARTEPAGAQVELPAVAADVRRPVAAAVAGALPPEASSGGSATVRRPGEWPAMPAPAATPGEPGADEDLSWADGDTSASREGSPREAAPLPERGMARENVAAGSGKVLPKGFPHSLEVVEKILQPIERQEQGKGGVALGTGIALKVPAMAAHTLETPAGAPGASQPPVLGIVPNTLPATPEAVHATVPHAATTRSYAAAAVEEVTAAIERNANTSRTQIELRLQTFDDESLRVRIEWRDGTVHTRFVTETTGMQQALSREWEHVAPRLAEKGLKFAEPTFEQRDNPDHRDLRQSFNFDQHAHQRQRGQAAESLPEFALPSFFAARRTEVPVPAAAPTLDTPLAPLPAAPRGLRAWA